MRRTCGKRIKPIFGHVGVKRAQIDRRKGVQALEHRGVVVLGIPLDDSLRELSVASEDVTVDYFEAIERQAIDGRIEVVQIRDQISERVADLAIRLDRSREDFLSEPDLLCEVAHRHPEAQDVGAAGLDDLLGLDRVPERLRHLPPIVGDDEAVRDHLAVGRAAARAEADEQRALKPAAVLIAALEVQVRRPRELGPDRQHGFMARTGVEPHIEDVHLAFEARPAARRTGEPGGHELVDGSLVPRVGAIRLEHLRRLLDEGRRQNRFAALRAVEGRNRHAPDALTRDAPIRPIGDHLSDPVVSPGRNPLDAVIDRLERRPAQRLAVVRGVRL